MPDFNELFSSEDFAAYQDRVVDAIVDWVHIELVKGGDSIRSGMMLAEKILSIPGRLDAKPEVQKRLDAAVKARLIAIPAKLFRKELKTE
jgi:hypothetical protein